MHNSSPLNLETGLIILMIIGPVFLYKGIVKDTVILYLCDLIIINKQNYGYLKWNSIYYTG